MLRRLTRFALRKGVLGGSRPWLAVGGALVGLRIVRVAAVGRPERIFRRELGPGESLLVATRRVAPE